MSQARRRADYFEQVEKLEKKWRDRWPVDSFNTIIKGLEDNDPLSCFSVVTNNKGKNEPERYCDEKQIAWENWKCFVFNKEKEVNIKGNITLKDLINPEVVNKATNNKNINGIDALISVASRISDQLFENILRISGPGDEQEDNKQAYRRKEAISFCISYLFICNSLLFSLNESYDYFDSKQIKKLKVLSDSVVDWINNKKDVIPAYDKMFHKDVCLEVLNILSSVDYSKSVVNKHGTACIANANIREAFVNTIKDKVRNCDADCICFVENGIGFEAIPFAYEIANNTNKEVFFYYKRYCHPWLRLSGHFTGENNRLPLLMDMFCKYPGGESDKRKKVFLIYGFCYLGKDPLSARFMDSIANCDVVGTYSFSDFVAGLNIYCGGSKVVSKTEHVDVTANNVKHDADSLEHILVYETHRIANDLIYSRGAEDVEKHIPIVLFNSKVSLERIFNKNYEVFKNGAHPNISFAFILLREILGFIMRNIQEKPFISFASIENVALQLGRSFYNFALECHRMWFKENGEMKTNVKYDNKHAINLIEALSPCLNACWETFKEQSYLVHMPFSIEAKHHIIEDKCLDMPVIIGTNYGFIYDSGFRLPYLIDFDYLHYSKAKTVVNNMVSVLERNGGLDKEVNTFIFMLKPWGPLGICALSSMFINKVNEKRKKNNFEPANIVFFRESHWDQKVSFLPQPYTKSVKACVVWDTLITGRTVERIIERYNYFTGSKSVSHCLAYHRYSEHSPIDIFKNNGAKIIVTKDVNQMRKVIRNCIKNNPILIDGDFLRDCDAFDSAVKEQMDVNSIELMK